jgi:prepilin-type N-terminal cleavage/methylation domain-containing protein
MRSRRRHAFTLLEVVLVMAIMVIFALLSYPTIQNLYADAKLQGASDSVRAAWSQAQAHAMKETRAYRFAVVPGTRNYRVAPDSDEFWSGDGAQAFDPDNPVYVFEDTLPKGIVFPDGNGRAPQAVADESEGPDEKVGTGQWTKVVVFLPDGTALDKDGQVNDVEMRLEYPATRPILLGLRAMTGTTSVQRGE